MGGGAVASGDFDALVAAHDQQGWRGLINNKKALGLATFASLGGVLYGYNQGVFGQVQVMEEFVCRYYDTVSLDVSRRPATWLIDLARRRSQRYQEGNVDCYPWLVKLW
jgi:hypothetical protein